MDALRGVAIALVLACHFPYFTFLARLGGSGVTLFFVLSGFLISTLLFEEYQQTGQILIKRFILRRGLKIWPSAYCYLLAVAFLFIYFDPPRPWKSLAMSAAFVSNYCWGDCAGVVGHTWSLAVEEHFYLMLPFALLFLLRRDRLSWLPWLCSILIVVCFGFRYFDPGVGAHEKTQCRIDSLFIGVTLGYFRLYKRLWFSKIASSWNLLPAVLLISSWLSPNATFVKTIGLLLVPLGYAFVLAWFVEHEPKTGTMKFLLTPLAKLGVYSYCVYLWQQVFTSLIYEERSISLSTFIILVGGSIVTGVAFAKLVEIPVLKVRERILPTNRVLNLTADGHGALNPAEKGIESSRLELAH